MSLSKEDIRLAQGRLNYLDYDAGPVDGDPGKRTVAAVRAFQAANGLVADGILSDITLAALMSPVAIRAHADDPRVVNRESPIVTPQVQLVTPAMVWPRQQDCTKFYGQPGNPECTRGIVKLPIKFRLAWDISTEIASFKCHSKCAAAFTRIFNLAVDHYGEAEYRRLRLDLFGGCYNLRQMRGGSAWSMHSWGIAVDLDPERNQLKWGKDRASFARREYDPFWKIVEDEGAVSLGRVANYDYMHFQFARP